MAQKAARLRVALFAAVSEADLRAVIKKLLDQAKTGDVAAAKIVMDRLLGPPTELDLLERLERIERAMEGNFQKGD